MDSLKKIFVTNKAAPSSLNTCVMELKDGGAILSHCFYGRPSLVTHVNHTSD